jgi:hypothetical protein
MAGYAPVELFAAADEATTPPGASATCGAARRARAPLRTRARFSLLGSGMLDVTRTSEVHQARDAPAGGSGIHGQGHTAVWGGCPG